MENTEEIMKVSDLRPRSRSVNMLIKVLEKGEVREIESRRDGSKHKISEAKVGDETAIVLLTLWDELIDKVEAGKVYQVKNGYTTLFRGNIRLNIGRYGELDDSTEEIAEVNEETNISEKEYEDRRRRGGFGRY